MALAFLSGCAEKPEALVASAKEFLAKNDRAAAIVQLKNSAAGEPGLGEARFLLGKAELETGQTAAGAKGIAQGDGTEILASTTSFHCSRSPCCVRATPRRW
jgi:hypothetical protein